MLVSIDGKLKWSQWQTQDGSNRSKIEVVAHEVVFFAPQTSFTSKPEHTELLAEDIPF